MKQAFRIGLGAALLSLALPGWSQESGEATFSPVQDVWRVVYHDFPPFTEVGPNGALKGFGFELLAALAAREGARIEARRVDNPGEIVAEIAAGRADIAPNLVASAEREAHASFTSPHAEVVVRAFAPRGGSADIAERWRLGDLRVGVTEGAFAAKVAERAGAGTVIYHGSNPETLAALARGDVDAAVFPEAYFAQLVDDLDIANRFVAVTDALATVPVSIAVDPKNTALLAQVENALNGFMATSEFSRLRADNLYTIEDRAEQSRLVTALLSSLSATLAIAAIWLVISRRRIAERERRAEREASAALAASNRELKARNREVEDLLYVVSHDLSSPLISIGGFARGAEVAVAGGNPEAAKSHLARVRANVAGMTDLIDGILEVSRAGRTEAVMETVVVGDLVEEVRGLLAAQIRESNGVVESSCARTVVADRKLLRNMLQNLVANALKHGRAERGAWVAVRTECGGGTCRVCVDDAGPGLPAAGPGRIFEMFQKGSGAQDGHGIGLAIVTRLAERMGARIETGTSPEGGARFALVFEQGGVQWTSSDRKDAA